MLARCDVLRALGPFDPRFFMYGEDIDLCYRLRAASWSIRFVPKAVITHVGGGSSRSYRPRMALRSTESMYLFYRKHYRGPALGLAVLIFRTVAAMKWVRDAGHLGWIMLCGREGELRRVLCENLHVWRSVLALSPPPLTPLGSDNHRAQHSNVSTVST
jgi:GT2 family glycosyltransferase